MRMVTRSKVPVISLGVFMLLALAGPLKAEASTAGLDEHLGRLLMVAFRGAEAPLERLQELSPGGFIFFAGNVPSTETARRITRELQSHTDRPLLFAVDQEGGPFSSYRPEDATLFPGNMALGAADDEDLTRRVAEAVGRELAYAGFNMNFAPVVDVNTSPDNPIIGIRAFGAEPALVARHGQAFLAGLQAAGVAGVAKHFPGHGDTTVDSHLALPSVDGDFERLQAVELPPFQALIDAGVPAVMTAHVAFPAFEEGVPATLSQPVLSGLLAEQMGFGGLVITDYMDMAAIADNYGAGEAAVKSIAAGADMVLLGPDFDMQREVLAALKEAVATGRLPVERVEQALSRIEAVAATYRPAWHASEPDRDGHGALAVEAALKGATLLWDDGVLPLARDQRVAVVAPRPSAFGEPPHLGAVLERHRDNVRAVVVSERPTPEERQAALRAAEESDLIVVGSYYWLGGYPDELKELVEGLLATGKSTVLVSLGNPDDLRHLSGRPAAYLAVYGYREANLEAAARVLVGTHRPQGSLPIPAGEFPLGSGER